MKSEFISRLIRISFSESEYPDDVVIAYMPSHITKEQLDAAIAKSAYIIRHFDDSYETDQDLIGVILDTVRSYISGFSWHYTDFFTEVDVNPHFGAYKEGGMI